MLLLVYCLGFGVLFNCSAQACDFTFGFRLLETQANLAEHGRWYSILAERS